MTVPSLPPRADRCIVKTFPVRRLKKLRLHSDKISRAAGRFAKQWGFSSLEYSTASPARLVVKNNDAKKARLTAESGPYDALALDDGSPRALTDLIYAHNIIIQHQLAPG